MSISTIMPAYIGRHFLLYVAAFFGVFILLIVMMDTIELLRRSASLQNMTFAMTFELALLRLPHMAQETLPFSILFGGMLAFWKLSRHSELVVIRAAGVSAWQFLLPALMIAFTIGVVKITIVNPFSSAALSRFEKLESIRFKGKTNLLALSEKGLWLRQTDQSGRSVIHATHALQQGHDVELNDVVFFIFSEDDKFIQRIDADSAQLEPGQWRLANAWIQAPETTPDFKDEHLMATDLTLNKIQDSFSPPETMSFWNLPSFIKTLEDAGFSAHRHRLYWHSLLADPLMMAAMVLIAATFTLRLSQRSGSMRLISGGLLTGFVIYFFSDIVFALGLSDSIPVILAAWTPAGVTMLLGLAMLLHLEDG